MQTCVRIHVRTRSDMHIRRHKHASIQTQTHACSYTYARTYGSMLACTHASIQMQTHACSYTYACSYMAARTHACKYDLAKLFYDFLRSVNYNHVQQTHAHMCTRLRADVHALVAILWSSRASHELVPLAAGQSRPTADGLANRIRGRDR